MIRQPIVVIAGHIDHGKSSILERVKGISITKGESGGITQSIKSYNRFITIKYMFVKLVNIIFFITF